MQRNVPGNDEESQPSLLNKQGHAIVYSGALCSRHPHPHPHPHSLHSRPSGWRLVLWPLTVPLLQ